MELADLVLEGGGVKSAGLTGAVSELSRTHRFHRVAGTSAGAIVAGFVAAGLGEHLEEITLDTDPSRFLDRGRASRTLGPLGFGLDLLLGDGLYRGEELHRWIADTLAFAGVRTWGDLRVEGASRRTPVEHRYRLVVIASDVTRGRMLRLPWDLERLVGVDPDDLLVADAIRASAAIPFFFRPWRLPIDPALTNGRNELVLTDGAMLSNYPIEIFDDDLDHPTFGVKLSSRRSLTDACWQKAENPISLGRALIKTLVQAHDRAHLDRESVASRTVFVETGQVRVTDFHLSRDTREELFENGRHAAREFLRDWDYARWQAAHGPLLAVA